MWVLVLLHLFVDWDRSDHICLVCLLSACDLQAHRNPQTFLKGPASHYWTLEASICHSDSPLPPWCEGSRGCHVMSRHGRIP